MKHSNIMVNRLKAYLTPTFTIRLREKRLEDIFFMVLPTFMTRINIEREYLNFVIRFHEL